MLNSAHEQLLRRALETLTASTGIQHSLEIDIASKEGCRVVLSLPGTPETQSAIETYDVLVRQIDRPGAAAFLLPATNAHAPRSRTLLVAPRITEATAQTLRQWGLEYLDIAGNTHLRAKHYFVLVTGQKTADPSPALAKDGSATSPTALKLIFAVLSRPALLSSPYREISRTTGVALGAVGPVLDDLQKRHFVAGDRLNRRLIDPLRLLDEWATNYPIRLRPKLHPRRFKAAIPDWAAQVDIREYDGWWGGEVAADGYTRFLKPATTTIYLKPNTGKLTAMVAKARMRPDPQGDIEILDAFWELPRDSEHPDLVPRILAYADLLASLDPRNIEVARMLRQEQIAHADHQTQDSSRPDHGGRGS